ncbi:MAG: fructokinase [Bacillales bacterium]|nr:fructokinase [Bacillales bacterium]
MPFILLDKIFNNNKNLLYKIVGGISLRNGVICLGEALIDLVPQDNNNNLYEKNAGGAPANVAVGLSRLGIKSSFLGMVGDDKLGHFLRETLSNNGVNISHMQMTKAAKTGVALVDIDENGERSFEFIVNPSADTLLSEEHIDEAFIEKNKILHFGSLSLINESSAQATMSAISVAKKHDLLVSFDPNIRYNLWKNEEDARNTINSVLEYVDVLKVTDEELFFLTNEKELTHAINKLANHKIDLIAVTYGNKGSKLFIREGVAELDALNVSALDTTGAGDAYTAGLLYCVNELLHGLDGLSVTATEHIGRFANIAGALSTSSKGAMKALPTLDQVHNILRNHE